MSATADPRDEQGTSASPVRRSGRSRRWPAGRRCRPEEIDGSPAVRLLRDRAGAVRRDLAIDAHTLSTMARVCRALDGMPLAIELAAARLRTMSIDQLARRLDDRFRLLTGGSRTALPGTGRCAPWSTGAGSC
ncbi:hypothetical protein NKG94_35445 [Micromonospora sp. M12]